MSTFFSPELVGDAPEDGRRHAPATTRNREHILEVMQSHLPKNPRVFEVASGSGEHAVYLAPRLSAKLWQPTDIEPANLLSIDAWRSHAKFAAISPAQTFDVLSDDISKICPHTLDVIMSANLIHIAPIEVAEQLITKAGKVLQSNGTLFFYGPFKRGGEHTSDSNADFDASLKSRNSDWGIRDLEEITRLAESAGFHAPTIVQMPANNLSVLFPKK